MIKDLKSELSGNFEDLVLACMVPPDQYLAKELHKAMDGIGTHDDTLVDILCFIDNATMKTVKDLYQQSDEKKVRLKER